MGHCFAHLTLTDRHKIYALLNCGYPVKEIAKEINVHISTIYREIKRAQTIYRKTDLTEEYRYNPDEAHRKYRWNLTAKGAPLKIGSDYMLAEEIEKKIICEKRSPAAALAEINAEKKDLKTQICVSTLYSYIDKGVFSGLTNKDLPQKGKAKRKYRKVKIAKKCPVGKSIEKRPSEIEGRKVFGHWEMDTVYGGKFSSKTALLVLTERKTRKEIIEIIEDRTAKSTAKALDRIEKNFGELFASIFRSITVDNGSEFSDPELLEKSIFTGKKRTQIYYCHPYSSYERGSNENQNKMIRRKYPKGYDFGKATKHEIKNLENWINDYPRKILNWETANRLFQKEIDEL